MVRCGLRRAKRRSKESGNVKKNGGGERRSGEARETERKVFSNAFCDGEKLCFLSDEGHGVMLEEFVK